jgi:forkhead box protein J2/3
MKQHTGSPERQEPAEYDFQGTGYFDGIPSFPVQNDTGRENAKQHRALQQPAPRPRKRSRRSLTPEEAASLAPLDEALQQQQQPSRKTTPKRRKGKGHEEGEGAGGASPPVPPYPKPDVSFYVLIKEAILSSPEQRLLLCEIYDAIQARYPYFKTAGDGWKVHLCVYALLMLLIPRPLELDQA